MGWLFDDGKTKDEKEHEAGQKDGSRGGPGRDFVESFFDSNTPYGKGYQNGADNRPTPGWLPDLSSGGSSSTRKSDKEESYSPQERTYSGGGGGGSGGGKSVLKEGIMGGVILLTLFFGGLFTIFKGLPWLGNELVKGTIIPTNPLVEEERSRGIFWTINRTRDDPVHPIILNYTPRDQRTNLLEVISDYGGISTLALTNVRPGINYKFEVGTDHATFHFEEYGSNTRVNNRPNNGPPEITRVIRNPINPSKPLVTSRSMIGRRYYPERQR